MSTNLHWEPSGPKVGHRLPKELKFALEKRYGGYFERTELTVQKDLQWLEALREYNVDGTQQLIEALQEFEVVDIWCV